MSDDRKPDDPAPSLAAPEPAEGISLDVEFVVPAAACDILATFENLTQTPRPAAETTVPPPPTEARTLAAVEALGASLHQKLDQLQTLFDREIRAEATRERIVDRLHAELQEYKQDLLLKVLRPVFVDLIQLHDDVGKMLEAPASEGSETGSATVERLVGLLRGVQQGIEDILYRQGVEPFVVEGNDFDPRRQRAIAPVPTDDPALARTVAVRHRKGFQAGDKVIRPEVVSVYAVRR